MKRTILCALLLSGCLLAKSQQKVFEYPMEPSEAGKIQFHGTLDSRSGNIILSLTARHDLRQYQLPVDSGAATFLSSMDFDGKENRYLTAVTLPDGVEVCIADKRHSLIRFLYCKTGEQQSRQIDSLQLPADQYIFASFYQQDVFYALTAQKGVSSVFIHRRKRDGSKDVQEKATPVKDWGKIYFRGTNAWTRNHVDDVAELTKTIGMIQEDAATPPAMVSLLAKGKLYIRPGILYLTFDNTHLI
ncbi:MAG: hypothetical protein JST68_07445, partial [Bacteroidetes bacterium]|nr:hypothetical protein [Bacteroidota bacterium]